MKEQTLNIQYQVVQLDELSDIEQQLVKKAMEATNNSYANYSHFHVGAACLLADGRIVIEPIRKMQPFHPVSALNAVPSSSPKQLSRASYHDSSHSCPQREWLPQKPDLPMWRMQAGNTRDGRPISATRLHLALRRELHLSLPQHQGLASILICRCQYERIKFWIISSD